MRRLPLALVVLICGPLVRTVPAHDIPNARVDRSIQATLTPDRLAIDYEVSLSELTLTRDLRGLIGALPGVERQEWFVVYGRETGPLNARGLLVTVDGRPAEVRFLRFDLAVEDHPRFTFHLEASTPPGGRLTLQDTNYVGSEGTSRLAIRGRAGVTLRGDDLPGDVESIAIRPAWQLSDAEERRTRAVAVDYASPPLASTPPEPAPVPAPASAERTGPTPPLPSSAGRPAVSPSPAFESGTGLTRLLDRIETLPLLALVGIACGLGAVHALQPGHGKTLVAATVLGERGTWMRGVVLAIVTTLTHTGSVLLVALGLWWTGTSRYGEIHRTLAHVAGGMIAAIGLWRLGRHLARYGEHNAIEPVDLDQWPAPALAPGSARGLIGLGLAGGLVPCWDAVALIVLAEAIGRLGLGIVLLLAFGLGMSLVLIAVGVLAGRLRRLMARGGGGAAAGAEYGPWERGLGIVSGVVLAVIGVYLLGIA